MNGSTPSEGISRRTIVKAAAWSAPVVALAAAAPAQAASGDPSFMAVGPFDFGAAKLFDIQTSNLPAVPASSESNYEGILIDFCLPDGLRVSAVSDGWEYINLYDDYQGGDAFVFNSVAMSAGADPLITVTIEKNPAAGALHGLLGAEISIGTTFFTTIIDWTYSYGDGSGDPLPNCAAFAGRG